MATQNLVSAVLAEDVQKNVLEKLESVRQSLDFLITLQANEVRSIFKVGTSLNSFIDQAMDVVHTHPEILPAVFNIDEFKKDYQLAQDLKPIHDSVKLLADAIGDTMLAINSDTANNALEVYSAVKLNCNRVPGLNVVAQEMAEYFKRAKRITNDKAEMN